MTMPTLEKVFDRLLMGLPIQAVHLLAEVWHVDIANRVLCC